MFIRSDFLSRQAHLHNRRFHFEGKYYPPSEFRVKTVNREKYFARLYIPAYEQRLLEGREREEIRLTGSVKAVLNGNGFEGYLQRSGYHGLVKIDRVHGSLSRAPPVDPGGWIASIRGKIRGWLEAREDYWPLSVSFLRALLLGEREALGRRLDSYFRRLGIVHLFVISGLHVGFLSWIFLSLLEKFSEKIKFFSVTFFLITYLYFLGWPVPAFRAGLMAWLGALALFLGRKINGWSLLISAVFILVLLNPFVFFDPGFHLTVGAVIGIFLVIPYSRVIPNKLLRLFIYGLGAYFGVLPAIIYHFNYFPRFGFVFSFLAGILFLPFLVLLAVQLPLMLVNWTFFAGLIEEIFYRGERGIEVIIHTIEPQAAVPRGTFWAVFFLAVSGWLLLDSRAGRYLKTGAIVLFIILFLYIQLPISGPHLTVNKEGETPFSHIHFGEQDYLILPRRVRFDLYEWRRIEQYLAEAGIFRITGLISDYPAGYFAGLDTELIIENFYTYWQYEDYIKEKNFKYDFENHRLYSPFGMISYNYPPGIEDSYDPSSMVGIFNKKTFIINNLDNVSRSNYEKLLEKDIDLHLLQQQEFRVELK